MMLPTTITSDLPDSVQQKWQRQFVDTGRKRHEGIWRRTQEPDTKKYSGYTSKKDARWKLVHFYDEYDLGKTKAGYELVLQKPYLWLNTSLPQLEMQEYYQKVVDALHQGGWSITEDQQGLTARLHNLCAVLKFVDNAEASKLADRPVLDDYRVIDVEIYGPDQHLTDEERERPWHILHGGIRKALKAGNPKIINGNPEDFDLAQYRPFHLELGCGPSIEAGVPPLSYLHKIYAISNPKTHEFLIGSSDDLLVRLFSDPSRFYMDASLIYATALKAKPNTTFYQSIKRLYEKEQILGPIFTNNYDGLTADLGLPERYLRKFDDSHVFPDVEFQKNAKALVVVGSHADRRKLQEKARDRGLQVIYVDPQHYDDSVTGKAYRYAIEAPQDSDIILNMTAQEFASRYM
jgi:hypothetical protein